MDAVNIILNAITTVGYPIVISLLAAWYIKYLGDKNSETIRTMQDQLKEISDKQNDQLDKMTASINEVQKALAVLTTTIDRKVTVQ